MSPVIYFNKMQSSKQSNNCLSREVLSCLCSNYAFIGESKGCSMFFKHSPVISLALLAVHVGEPCSGIFYFSSCGSNDRKHPLEERDMVFSRMFNSLFNCNLFKLHCNFSRSFGDF